MLNPTAQEMLSGRPVAKEVQNCYKIDKRPYAHIQKPKETPKVGISRGKSKLGTKIVKNRP